MHQEPFVADEVVVVFGNGEIVNDGEAECKAHGLTLTDEMFESIVHKIQMEKGLELAAYQPRFLLDQVVGSCRFMEMDPHLERRFLQYAIDNLGVEEEPSAESNAEPEHVGPVAIAS